ncbi:MAG: tetratricopeptide repeat protein [Chloroflexi bacterium]|nr:tetratricopeptide repeat protein [Chloroflexota bacterium]
MTADTPSVTKSDKGAEHNELGLKHYAEWQIDDAVAAFQKAITTDSKNPEYHLNLARAYARGGKYPEAMRSLGNYLHNETDENVAARYERLFSTALDEVETILIERMRQMEMPIQQIGKAIQMWLEYRITAGRKLLRIPKPELWAAALAYATCKINFVEKSRAEVAGVFGVSERSLKEKYDELRQSLDLMPADYRYFTGEENPLDKLMEAAQLLDQIYRSFQED